MFSIINLIPDQDGKLLTKNPAEKKLIDPLNGDRDKPFSKHSCQT